MAERPSISEDKIQDYIDGRLSEADEASMAAYLLAHPDLATEIQVLRQQNEALKGVGAEILNEPVPKRLTAVLDAARRETVEVHQASIRRRVWLEAATLAATLLIGIVSGWFAHGYLRTGPGYNDLAFATARDAYLLFSSERDYPVEFAADREDELHKWLTRVFKRQITRPNLAEVGYKYVGGRLLPWSRGNLGLHLYESEKGDRVSIVFWPSKTPPSRLHNISNLKNLRARMLWGDGLGYAVMSDPVNKDFDRIAGEVLRLVSASKK